MDAEVPPKKNFTLSDLKLYVYGSRESDQFWLPSTNSHSRRPFCLTDVDKFTFNNQDEDDDQQQGKSKQPIINPLYNQAIYKIACGSIHSVVLTTDGRVFTFGCNDEGALGRKGTQCIPIEVKLDDPIDMIAAGDNHSLFANSVNGAIYFTGNYNYKRGEKMTASVFEPTKIYASEINISNKNKRIQKLSCGANHSCILINNKIFCRGEPQASTIGRRMSKRHKVENSLTFNGVNLSDVVDLQCGGYHTVAKIYKNSKTSYYSWGTNDHGQLGIGTFESQAFPTEIKKLREKDIVKISAGASFTLFLTREGELYGCGNNEDSNLGLGDDFEYQQQGQSSNQQESNQEKETSKKQQVAGSNMQLQLIVNGQSDNAEKSEMKNQVKESNEEIGEKSKQKQKQVVSKSSYIKSVVRIELPEVVANIATGDNFGYAWNKQNLYSWGMGYGYVLLNGEQNDQTSPFKVKSKIINNQTIYELDAGNQHVVYTSYPQSISQGVRVEPTASVYQNLSVAKHGLRRRK